ncbi:MAG: helix-turn-helix domain-containing protein [Clostridiales bacterium]|jgi:DNA-directed RNA polymerase specialized sigma24 family protein|nr:helix-turn-helix domain-containing protein [Clostridiales bacterium]
MSMINFLRVSGHYLNHVKTALARRSAILERTETPEKTTQEDKLFGEDVKMIRQYKLQCRLLTPAEQAEAIEKYQEGLSMAAVADIYGCHYTTIGRLLRQRGVGIRNPHSKTD